MKPHHHAPRAGLLGSGLAQRLALAAAASTLLWVAVFWALSR
ncbi:MAG TPA: hypothetical protein PKM39_09735 [Pseudothauera hydrothermalis]|nr:hypothetical protein [Pseudothauera hydrothermalis]HNQ76903.1 hypothetical protein [Pseudothauera hydrothermalis]